MSSHPITLRSGLVLVLALGVLGVGGARAFAVDFTADDFKKVIPDMPAAKVFELLGKPKETVDVPAPLELRVQYYESKGAYYGVALSKDGKVFATVTFKNKQDFDKDIEMMKVGAKVAPK